jgi:hypothetical protein
MQESNQRKSRKNNASPRKLSTRTPLFFPPHAHGICLFNDFMTPKILLGSIVILHTQSIYVFINRKGVILFICSAIAKYFLRTDVEISGSYAKIYMAGWFNQLFFPLIINSLPGKYCPEFSTG